MPSLFVFFLGIFICEALSIPQSGLFKKEELVWDFNVTYTPENVNESKDESNYATFEEAQQSALLWMKEKLMTHKSCVYDAFAVAYYANGIYVKRDVYDVVFQLKHRK